MNTDRLIDFAVYAEVDESEIKITQRLPKAITRKLKFLCQHVSNTISITGFREEPIYNVYRSVCVYLPNAMWCSVFCTLIDTDLRHHNGQNVVGSRGAASIYRGYYTVARRYEFYARVARTISHKWAQWTSEILFLLREHKIHIFEPPCNVFF